LSVVHRSGGNGKWLHRDAEAVNLGVGDFHRLECCKVVKLRFEYHSG
jgi:hypothetical protein